MNLRPYILALAATALISGCGSSTDSVNVEPSFDTTAPGAPGQVSVLFDASLQRNRITWEPSAAADVAGYQIYSYDPDPMRESAYAMYGETDSAVNHYDVTYAPENRTMYVRVRAVDTAGNLGAFTAITPVAITASHYDVP